MERLDLIQFFSALGKLSFKISYWFSEFSTEFSITFHKYHSFWRKSASASAVRMHSIQLWLDLKWMKYSYFYFRCILFHRPRCDEFYSAWHLYVSIFVEWKIHHHHYYLCECSIVWRECSLIFMIYSKKILNNIDSSCISTSSWRSDLPLELLNCSCPQTKTSTAWLS